MTKKTALSAFAVVSVFALAACGAETPAGEAQTEGEMRNETLAALIENSDKLSTTATMLGNSGLQNVFDGPAAYTVFAPTNEAFEGMDLPPENEAAQAARAAILREHIVPGFMTRDDIIGAVESAGGSVEMQTMGSNTLTFREENGTLILAASDGSEARVTGPGLSGSNGSVLPIDGVLKSLDAPG